MDIDLSTLRMIERDKDIPLDYLLTTLEDALLNAYDKTEAPVNGAKVQLDRKTGNVAVMLPEKDEEGQVVGWYDGTPEDFGRVAASTARQVIFQRLREAEDEQKYGHFSAVEGDVITGVVQQSYRDTRTVRVDLGSLEGIMPPGTGSRGEIFPWASYPCVRRGRAQGSPWPAGHCLAHSPELGAQAFCYGGTRDRAGGRRDQGAGS